MHITAKLAAAAFAVAIIALPNLATAAGSAGPTPPPDAPAPEVAAAPVADNSKVYPETGMEDSTSFRHHDAGVVCFDDPLHQNVLWIYNDSAEGLPTGTKIVVVAQPGNKKITFTLPFPWPAHFGWIALPVGSRPDAKRVSCAVTNVVLPHRH